MTVVAEVAAIMLGFLVGQHVERRRTRALRAEDLGPLLRDVEDELRRTDPWDTPATMHLLERHARLTRGIKRP